MITEIPIILEPGKIVYPFAGKTEFLPIDGRNLFTEHYNPVRLASSLKFNGIDGGLYACVPSRPLDSGGYYPLGPVTTDITGDDFNNPEVRHTPLHLAIYWTVKSIEELEMMLRYSPRVDINVHDYIIRYVQEDIKDFLVVAKNWFAEGMPLHLENKDGRLTYRNLASILGMATPTIVPDDLEKLTTVALTMEEKTSLVSSVSRFSSSRT